MRWIGTASVLGRREEADDDRARVKMVRLVVSCILQALSTVATRFLG